MYCTPNASAAVPSACTGARSMSCPPDGAFVALEDAAFAVRGDALLHWTPEGYDARNPRPRRMAVDVLTPPAMLAVLSAGYRPRWHSSAND